MFYVRLALYFVRYKIKKNLNYENNDFLPMDERSSKAVELGAFSFIPVYNSRDIGQRERYNF